MSKSKRTSRSRPSSLSESVDQHLNSEFSGSDHKITVRREADKLIVSVAVRFYRRDGRQMVLTQNDSAAAIEREPLPPNTTLIANLAKAWHWQEQLESGEFGSLEELATANGVSVASATRSLLGGER